MIREITLSHNKDGWALSISETPEWAYLVTLSYEAALTGLGHPCCGKGAWKYLPGLIQFRLLNNRIAHMGYRHDTTRYVPISKELAIEIDAEWVEENSFLEEH